MHIDYFPKDIYNLYLSYLTKDEITYMKGDWTKFDINKVCEIAAKNNWFDLLIWATQDGNNYECNDKVSKYAALNGNLEMLKWCFLRTKYIINDHICKYAAKGGNLKMLKWLINNACNN